MSKLAHSNQKTMDEIEAASEGKLDEPRQIGPLDFARAFLRNCPSVKMTKDEQDELWRLFQECHKNARTTNPTH